VKPWLCSVLQGSRGDSELRGTSVGMAERYLNSSHHNLPDESSGKTLFRGLKGTNCPRVETKLDRII